MSVIRRVLDWLYLPAGYASDVAAGVGSASDLAYKHMLWMMREEAGSTTDAWAGPAYSNDLAVKYDSVNELLDGQPEIARYVARDNGEGPIFWGCFYGPLSLVERLVSMGADPHATARNSILIWFERGGMQYIPQGCTTLMMAAAGGQTDVVRYLLDLGVPADARALEGHSALFMAARGLGNGEIVRVLVQAGADPNQGSSIGFTPAGEVAARGAGGVLEALVEAGVDLSVPSGSKSVSELAAASGDPGTTRPLIRGSFGRILTLEDVTAALVEAGIEHEVVLRTEAESRDADVAVYMPVYAKIMDDDHWDIENTPDFYIFAGRTWDELSAFDLEEWLEDMNVGSRRFGDEAEIKALLGIAEGGITPFAEANDRHEAVVFRLGALAGEGKVALDAFDQASVVVLKGDDVARAVDVFSERLGPPERAGEAPTA
jgi:hypothetical protein